MNSATLLKLVYRSVALPLNLSGTMLLQILQDQVDISAKLEAAFECIDVLQARIDELVAVIGGQNEVVAAAVAEYGPGLAMSDLDIGSMSSSMESLCLDNNYLQQKSIDKDLYLSGFPYAPDLGQVARGLSETFEFPKAEITQTSAMTSTNGIANTVKHGVFVSLETQDTKARILRIDNAEGPVFLSEILGLEPPPAQGNDPQIVIAPRLTLHNIQLQKELLKVQEIRPIHKIYYQNCGFVIVPSRHDKPIVVRTHKDVADCRNTLIQRQE